MEYKSICGMCGRQTPPKENLFEHLNMKKTLGFVEVNVQYIDENLNYRINSINFCPTCAQKPYTIDNLKIVRNFNEWSY
jgi:hypothetical protein